MLVGAHWGRAHIIVHYYAMNLKAVGEYRLTSQWPSLGTDHNNPSSVNSLLQPERDWHDPAGSHGNSPPIGGDTGPLSSSRSVRREEKSEQTAPFTSAGASVRKDSKVCL